ncbi:unnamed protein product [Penicillium salamii]|uniref:BRCT domain-containing protein n=1 Tax=Penicillium salamii TaxID=1612424 RepID=A0A9W4NUB8_9EURO|nr:unnamed protein product [Penicillium salamii]CAG8038015.1 unnamed protein product [Penicillium salamii]CAG8053589.1 unnamed protein product [Penicillium salamii]CAG8116139.1 unnamed protein product [Penicillium salamii]CAG8259333.1 unnamed protein product [Penicillium salamii]
MESQDSIDFAKIQRDALGLVCNDPAGLLTPHWANSSIQHDPFQPNISQSIKSNTLRPTHEINDISIFNGQPPKPSLGRPNRSRHPLFRPRQHAAHMMMNNDENEAATAPDSQFANMSSAEATPGDTQVVSQSVYDSIIRQNEESMRDDYSQTGADGATLRTLHEGDSGHIDLLAELETHRETAFSQDDNDIASTSEPNQSSPMAFAPNLFPESQRFLAETPATAVKRNDMEGVTTETPTVSRNPLADDIESSGGILRLSQLFGATQAPSSPLVHGLHPELASDRPSPNIPIQRARFTNGISSPMVGLPGHFMRDSSEPNLNYISMKESQTNRDRTLDERMVRSADNILSDQSDKEFYKESSFVERARRQREIDAESAAQFNGLSAPARSTSAIQQTSPEPPTVEDQVMAEIVASEEETEQEEDSVMQVPKSQDAPQSSMEEDKENFDGPLDAAATTSAHDRLSQMLGYDANDSPSRGGFDPENGEGVGCEGSLVSHTSGQPNGIVRSSQIMVKDSQPSPESSPKRIDREHRESILKSPTPSHSRARLSPRERLRSSPPLSRPTSRHSNSNHKIQKKDGSVTLEHVVEPEATVPLDENVQMNTSNTPDEQVIDSSRSEAEAGTRGASSSMPIHATQTPVHRSLKNVGDLARLTSIPETSPTHSHCNSEAGYNVEGVNNEDDDLPPMFNGVPTTGRNNHNRPTGARALSSPLKKLLSSPGGGQRRALTEIAADLSPQVGAGGFDLGIEMFTTGDPEIRALMEGSPTRPKKRRRGNNSSSYIASDPIIPITPRPHPPKSVAPTHSSQSRSAAIPEEPTRASFVQVPETETRRQPKPQRRANDNIWEVECSPEQAPRRKSRIGKKAVSRSMQEKHVPTKSSGLVEKPAPSSKLVISSEPSHRPPSHSSSDLTEVSSIIASDDIVDTETNSVQDSPTTPRKSRTSSEDSSQIAPSQVLAVWMGHKRAYYPATCFGTPLGVSQTKYSVKFEDSLPLEVTKGAVKRFELRIGDGVKIDMPNVPKVTHIVRGFDDKFTREDLAKAVDDGLHPITDIYGHSTVIVGPKQRKSLPNGGLNRGDNVIRVPIARVYLDTILWNQLKDRAFTYRPTPVLQENTVHTPSEKSVPASPSSRLSRSIYQGSGIFAGMAFAVSYKDDETSKNRITRLIMENGGTVLHDGFTELFEAASIVPTDTPTKLTGKEASNSKGLRLTTLAEDVGFACLIADTHSRREKYMQALALNIPCLSGRWVEDCISKSRVVDWDIYLLPAGDSMYLNGATKSRLMLPTPPTTARLSETISARPKLLAGHSVLLVMGRGKAEEKRKAYIFLTYALGASRVDRVPDLSTARALIDSQAEAGLPSWDWIYVDDADQAAARSMLAPRTQRIHLFHGKKRKKSIASSTPVSETNCTTRVVGNEFVCQSLILGRLFE